MQTSKESKFVWVRVADLDAMLDRYWLKEEEIYRKTGRNPAFITLRKLDRAVKRKKKTKGE